MEHGLTRFGVSGHQALPPGVGEYASAAIRRQLSTFGRVVGLSSLAAGSDQLFARLIIERSDGELVAVIPCQEYETSFETPSDLKEYRRLLALASDTHQLPFPKPSEEAFWAAGKSIVDQCEVLVAVWDGRPSRGLGGTADVVKYARSEGRDVVVIWPHGIIRP